MESFYYTREFFYRERRSFDEFFAENALWKILYDFFDGKENGFGGCFHPQLVDFNEAYLYFNVIMVGLLSDKELEDCYNRQFHSIYVNPFDCYQDNINNEFCLVLLYVLLALREDLTKSQKHFLKSFEHVDFAYYEDWYDEMKSFVTEQKAKDVKYDLWYGVLPERPETFMTTNSLKQKGERGESVMEVLVYDYEWWWLQTNRFDALTILRLVELWKSPVERLQIISFICDRYKMYYKLNDNGKPFDNLCEGWLAESRKKALSQCVINSISELPTRELVNCSKSGCVKSKCEELQRALDEKWIEVNNNRLLEDKIEELRWELLHIHDMSRNVSDILDFAEKMDKNDAKVVKTMIDSVFRGVNFSDDETRRIDALAMKESGTGVSGVVIENMHGSVNGSVTQNIDMGKSNNLIDK